MRCFRLQVLEEKRFLGSRRQTSQSQAKPDKRKLCFHPEKVDFLEFNVKLVNPWALNFIGRVRKEEDRPPEGFGPFRSER